MISRDPAASTHWPRIILSGHAKLPQDAAAQAVYDILSIVVAAEPQRGRILEVDSTLVTTPAKAFLQDLLLDVYLDQAPGAVLSHVERYYWGGAKKALVAAIKDLYSNWHEFQSLGEAT